MRVLETRATPEGFKRRRYESASGERHTTIEVPQVVWDHINRKGRGRDRMAQFERVRERESLRRQATSLKSAGFTNKRIALALQQPLRTIQDWTK